MVLEHTHDPSSGAVRTAARSGGSVIPKILAIVAILNLLRMVASHKRGNGEAGSSWRDRRKSMIAELHRQLHEQDAEEPTKA